MMPLMRIDWASSASRSDWNTRRGWSGLGSMTSMETARSATSVSVSCSGGAWVRLPRSVCIPLPSALRGLSILFMVQNLFGELDVSFGSFGTGIVCQDRLSETRRLREANTARDNGSEDI